MAKQITLKQAAAQVDETQSKTALNMAKAQSEGMPQGADSSQLPPQLHIAKAVADINETNATATHKQALANKLQTESRLAPHVAAHDAAMQRAQLGLDAHMQAAKLGLDAHNAEQDRISRMKALNGRNGND
jgi:hypothetical protein